MSGNLFCLGGVGVIFVLVALFAARSTIKDWRRYRESGKWVPVTGQIITSNVTARNSSKGGSIYGINVLYDYQVMGQAYQGDQVSFGAEGTGFQTRRKAEKQLARFPMGGKTTIYYDPNDPRQAVLERKFDITGAILVVILGLAGLAMIVFSYVQLSTPGN